MGWDTMESLNMGYSIISEPIIFIFIFVPSFLTQMSFYACPFSTDAKSLPAGILSIPNPNEIDPNHAKIGIQSMFKCILFGYPTALPQATRRSYSKWPNGSPHADIWSGGIGAESLFQCPFPFISSSGYDGTTHWWTHSSTFVSYNRLG